MIFICKNPDCTENGKEVTVLSTKRKYNAKTDKIEIVEAYCPVCKQYREAVDENKGIGANLAKFSMLNRAQKAELLKKRSKDHTARTIGKWRKDIEREKGASID